MGLNIKDERVHQQIRQLADATGQTMTGAVRSAVEEKLARLVGETADDRVAHALAIAADAAPRFRERWATVADPTAELYDADGLPA